MLMMRAFGGPRWEGLALPAPGAALKLLYYYWNQPSQPKLAQSVPMGVLEGLGGVGHALGTN